MRWTNVPVPEAHVAGLLVGFVLHRRWPWRLTGNRRWRRVREWIGRLFVAAGVLGIAWSVRAVGAVDVERGTDLVTTGPYAISRNPMYVAWTTLYAGVGFLTNAAWLFVLLPPVAAVTHAVVRREERTLSAAFGDEYREYRRAVRRYL